MTLPRIVRTASFRFAVILAGFILVSGLTLGLIVYRSVSATLERQVAEQVDREMERLLAEYRANGLEHLTLQVNRRQNARGREALDYSLQGVRGVVLAGVSLPAGATSGRISVPGADGVSATTLFVRTRQLPMGETLIVGTDVDWIANVQDKILTAFASALGFIIAFSLIGGLWLSSRFLLRLDAMTRTATSIIGGDFSSRIPVSAAGDDFDQLGGAFNTMLDRLATTMESLRQVSNDIAHDLRTPLARLQQTLDEASRNAADQKSVRQAFVSAGEQVDDILATFSALLRIAQIESGARRRGFAALDLATLARAAAEDFRSVAEDKGQTLSFHGEHPQMIDGDRELLTQLIVNLIENAIRHTPRGSRIEVGVAGFDREVVLTVSDNGPGVPEAERARIFDRFYRTEASRTTPGDGLGLSLASAIAELHGARIAATDAAPGLAISVRFARKP